MAEWKLRGGGPGPAPAGPHLLAQQLHTAVLACLQRAAGRGYQALQRYRAAHPPPAPPTPTPGQTPARPGGPMRQASASGRVLFSQRGRAAPHGWRVGSDPPPTRSSCTALRRGPYPPILARQHRVFGQLFPSISQPAGKSWPESHKKRRQASAVSCGRPGLGGEGPQPGLALSLADAPGSRSSPTNSTGEVSNCPVGCTARVPFKNKKDSPDGK